MCRERNECMPKSTIRVGQRLIAWDGTRGYVALNSQGKRVYGMGERFKIEWLDTNGEVENAQYVSLEHSRRKASSAAAVSCRGQNNTPHKGKVWTPNWICPSPPRSGTPIYAPAWSALAR